MKILLTKQLKNWFVEWNGKSSGILMMWP